MCNIATYVKEGEIGWKKRPCRVVYVYRGQGWGLEYILES
jgi:hypothetical protein